jgi:hypothetical protein
MNMGDKFAVVLSCLAVRLALVFLMNEDASRSNPAPSFAPFSGALPLMYRLNFTDLSQPEKRTAVIYGSKNDDGLSSWKDRTTEKLSHLLINVENYKFDTLLGYMHKYKDKKDADHRLLLNELMAQIGRSEESVALWRGGRRVVFDALPLEEVLGSVAKEINLPADPAMRERMFETMSNKFMEAVHVWSLAKFVAENDRTSESKSNGYGGELIERMQRELDDYDQMKARCQQMFSEVGDMQISHKEALDAYVKEVTLINSRKHALMHPTMLTLRDVERIHSEKIDTFVTSFPDAPFGSKVSLDSMCVIAGFDPDSIPISNSNYSPYSLGVYVTDNNAIRRITSENSEDSKYICCGSVNAGSRVGTDRLTAEFYRPLGLCMHHLDEGKNVMVVADTGNNCLRFLPFTISSSTGFNCALGGGAMGSYPKKPRAGHEDGDASTGLLHKPTGVASFGRNLIVCDTENHVLRKFVATGRGDVNSVTWVAHTVAGIPTEAGMDDGAAVGHARLTSPLYVTCSGKTAYFTEEGHEPALRKYTERADGSAGVVSTLHRGAPLVNPTGICMREDESLLICDWGAHCIWSYNIRTEELKVAVSQEDIFKLALLDDDKPELKGPEPSSSLLSASAYPADRYSAASSSSSSSAGGGGRRSSKADARYESEDAFVHEFMPFSIARMSEGCYIFSDKISTKSLYRVFETDLVAIERGQTLPLYRQLKDLRDKLGASTSAFKKSIDDATSMIVAASATPLRLKTTVMEGSYREEFRQLDSLTKILDHNSLGSLQMQLSSVSTMSLLMLHNAPTLKSAAIVLRVFLSKQRKGTRRGMGEMILRSSVQSEEEMVRAEDDMRELQDTLRAILVNRNYAAHDLDIASETDALVDLIRTIPSVQVRRAVLSDAFRNETFNLPVNAKTVELIASALDLLGDKDPAKDFGHFRPHGDKDLKDGDSWLKGSTLIWLKRQISTPKSFKMQSFEDTMHKIFSFWMDVVRELPAPPKTMKKAFVSEVPKEEGLRKAWHWLVCLHIEDFSQGFGAYAKTVTQQRNGTYVIQDQKLDKSEKFLLMLPSLCDKVEPLMEDSLCEIAGKVAVQHMTPDFAITTLLNGVSGGSQVSQVPQVSQSHAFVLQSALIALVAKAFHDLENLNVPVTKAGVGLTKWEVQLRLLSVHPGFWAKYMQWCGDPKYGDSRIRSRLTEKLSDYFKMLLELFDSLSQSIVRGHVTVEVMKLVIKTHVDLKQVWIMRKSSLSSVKEIKRLQDELDMCWVEASTLKQVMTSLMPEADELKRLSSFMSTWDSQFVGGIRSLLQLEQPPDYQFANEIFKKHHGDHALDALVVKIEPIPNIMCSILDWLVIAEKSEFFKRYWKDNCGIGSVDGTALIARKWSQFLTQLRDGSLPLDMLEKYGDYLLNPSEVTIFTCTAGGVALDNLDRGDLQTSFVVLAEQDPRTISMTHDVSETVSRWKHMRTFYFNESTVKRVLSTSRHHLIAAEHHNVTSQETALANLKAQVDSNGPWPQQAVKNLSVYWMNGKLLDPRLLKVPFALLLAIQTKLEMIMWLRTIKDDEVFSSSIEMARSLQEMNCPLDLWDAASQRVNEAFLSMISNIRSYLHTYLYRAEHQVDSFDMFLEIFSELNAKTDPNQIIRNISKCSEVSGSLTHIIGVKTDSTGSSRLTQLYSEECNSTWRCMRTVHGQSTAGSDGTVVLRYQTEAKESSRSWRQHLSSDLLDFQSNIVLERSLVIENNATDLKAGTDENIVDRFLNQFSWMRRLSDVLLSLYTSGHFDFYPEYCMDIPVAVSADDFRGKVLFLEREQVEWERHVSFVRDQHYFINYIDLKRCFILKNLLEDASARKLVNDGREAYEDFTESVSDFSCFLNPEHSHNRSSMREIASKLLSSWEANQGHLVNGHDTDPHAVAKKKLQMLAVCLDEVFTLVPRRTRPVSLPDVDLYVINEKITRGIHVAYGQNVKGMFDHLLTLSVIQGELPEWETTLFCNKNTSKEQVSLMIRRWHRAHKHGRENVMYVMMEVDKLPYEAQHAAVRLIRELGPPGTSNGPLILVAESGENCYLTAQFHFNRVNHGILPQPMLAKLGETISGFGRGLHCHVSEFAGAGKSFDIRQRAAREKIIYAHVPINSSHTPASSFIRRIKENIHRSRNDPLVGDVLLHIDIASTAGLSLISQLFSIGVIGIIADMDSDAVYAVNPSTTIVCLELAPGMHRGAFAQCKAYPIIENVVSSSTFAFNRTDLMRGMGPEFDAVLYGSLTPGVAAAPLPPSTAFQRLAYVLDALNVHALNDGSFPFDFASNAGVDEVAIEKERCFDLLMTTSGLGRNPSLWNLWSYVNVLYWQLQEIQSSSSPVHLACMPDTHIKLMSVEFDTAMKRRVKGEMVNFIIKTAREFATRQTVVGTGDPDRVVGVILRNFSSVPETKTHDPNLLFWKRETFDNDGHPVFKSPAFYQGFQITARTANRDPNKYFHYYLHFRESENRWVIDDTVNYTGGVISYSRDNQPLGVTKFEKRTLKAVDVQVEIKDIKTADPQAYNGEAITVNGFEKCKQGPGTVVSKDENGTYFRLPPSEDIDGKKHFLKPGPEGRHLYFLQKNAIWVFAKTCNAEVMGAQAYSKPKAPHNANKYVYFPPNTVEEALDVSVVTAGQAAQVLADIASAAPPQPGARANANGAGGGGIAEEKAEPAESAMKDEIAMELDSQGLGVELTRWRDSNHECVFFNNDTGIVSFLSLDPDKLRKTMHPVLLKHLINNKIDVGEDLRNLNDNHWNILSSLTGVKRSKDEIATLFDSSFCLTGDSLLKILAIVYRIRCKIPVVLLGECGCGKTMLLSFLCQWLNIKLLCLDVHGGTTEQDIIGIFDQAGTILQCADPGRSADSDDDEDAFGPKTVVVFLDEVNTCAHMGLLNEAICHRSIYGRRLADGIQILGALNPYRLRPKKEEMGLMFNLGHNPMDDPMSRLVYRVHPIPPTLKDYIFDFGSLEPDTELLYIRSMISNRQELTDILGTTNVEENRMIISVAVHKCQEYVRKVEGDPSVVSLRDVKRTLVLIRWFNDELPSEHLEGQKVGNIARATILAIAHVYCYRLSSSMLREGLWELLTKEIHEISQKQKQQNDFNVLSTSGAAQAIVMHAQQLFVENLEIEDGISMNRALTENLFVAIICILNRIPIFIVGKPGTSKTLAIQVIQNNLQGKQSPKAFWRQKPSVHIFQYQCSPMSTSHSIKFMFEAAKSFQEHSSDVLTVLLLDEVGLAENSPEMPLKVLHYMLVDPPVAIVGLSNWALDSSKMNRAICLQRPEPSESDIMLTGRNIVAAPEQIIREGSYDPATPTPPTPLRRQLSRSASTKAWLGPLAKAYLHIYTHQRDLLGTSRDFIGMRDYYSMLKYLRAKVAYGELTPELLASAVSRNFGGRPDSIKVFLPIFYEACFGEASSTEDSGGGASESKGEKGIMEASRISKLVPPTTELVNANLESHSSRHLMILSQNETVLQLLFGCQIIDEATVSVLVGSRFKDDLEELHLIQQINKVKRAMAEGKVAVLLNNENIYESLYDVLNQRYVRQRDPETGVEHRLLRLAMGSRSQLCPVENDFKLIVIVQQSHAYDHLDLPLLNRFEKQILSPGDVLTPEARKIAELLESWCKTVLGESGLPSYSNVFCGFYDGTISSLVLSLTDFCRLQKSRWDADELVKKGKLTLLKMATPIAILQSKTLRILISGTFKGGQNVDSTFQNYLVSRAHLFALLDFEMGSKEPGNQLLQLATRSPVHHFDIALKNWVAKNECIMDDGEKTWTQSLKETDVMITQLAHVASERTLLTIVEAFYGNAEVDSPSLLAVLCDPLHCNMSLISHARYIAFQAWHAQKLKGGNDKPKHIIFVINLPPGISSRVREFTLDIYPPWSYLFLDDLIAPEDIGGPDLSKMLHMSLYDLCNDDKLVNLKQVITKNFQSSLAECSIAPLEDEADPRGDVSYVKMLKVLLADDTFMQYTFNSVLACLHDAAKVKGMELHVYKACENVRGSLRQSIQLSIENIIKHGMAHVLRTIDVNYNMSLLYTELGKGDEIMKLWLDLADRVHPPDLTAMSAPRDLSKPPESIIVPNTGLRGPFACKFPFSNKIIGILAEAPRGRVEQLAIDMDKVRHSLDSLLNANLDPSLTAALYDRILTRNKTAYLYDFVMSCIYPQQYVSADTTFAVVKALIDAADTPQSLSEYPYTPAAVQAAYWVIENRIFHVLSAFSLIRTSQEFSGMNLFIETNFDQYVIAELIGKTGPEARGPNANGSVRKSINQADVVVTAAILQVVEESYNYIKNDITDTMSFNHHMSQWCRLFSSVQIDMEALLALTMQYHEDSGASDGSADVPLKQQLSADVYAVVKKWWHFKAVRALLTEYLCEESKLLIGRDGILPVLNALTQCDPTSVSSLQAFIDVCKSYVYSYSNFVKCYLIKFVRPEFDMLARFGYNVRIPFDLLRLIGMLSFAQNVKDPSFENETSKQKFKDEELALQRTAVDTLYRASIHSRLDDVNVIVRELFSFDKAAALKTCQLFIERAENDSLTELKKAQNGEANHIAEASGLEVFDACLRLSPAKSEGELCDLMTKEGIEILFLIAKAKALISGFAEDIYKFLNSTDEKQTLDAINIPSGLPSIFSNTLEVQLNFFITLAHFGGKSVLLSYLRRQKVPVIMDSTKLIDPESAMLKSIDPFSSLGGAEAYVEACAAAVQVRTYGDISVLDTWWKSNGVKSKSWADKMQILIAAMFTQITSNGIACTPVTVDSVIEWVRKDALLQKDVPVNLFVDIIRHFLSVRKVDATTVHESLQQNLQLHVILCAMRAENGWVHQLLTDPAAFKQFYIPGMQDSEMSMVVNAGADLTSWYECPNGHKYAIGNCGWPMQKTKCPVVGCGRTIGGEQHQSAAGAKRLGARDELSSNSKAGYLVDNCEDVSYEIWRLGKLCTGFLRFCIHSVLKMNAELYPTITQDMRDQRRGGRSTAAELMYPNSEINSIPASRILREVQERLQADFAMIKSVLQYDEEDIAMGLHMCLSCVAGKQTSARYQLDESHYGERLTDEEVARRLQMQMAGESVPKRSEVLKLPPGNMAPLMRAKFEQDLENDVTNPIFTKEKSRANIQREKKQFENDNIDKQLQDSFGPLYYQIMEIGLPQEPGTAARMNLWRSRESISFTSFERAFNLRASNRTSYPVIATVLKYVDSLPLIRYGADILAWQAIVFRVMKADSITRDEASKISNGDIIAKLPESERANATQVLQKYCIAFNATIAIGSSKDNRAILRECAENIFISRETGAVDLSCAGLNDSMSPDTSIAFTLPSTLKERNEFLDPRALCTVFILSTIQDLQKNIVDALLNPPLPEENATAEDGVGGGGISSTESLLVKPNAASANFKVPTTTYMTPYGLICRRLMSFHRESQLMPSVYTYAKQNTDFGRGQLLGFDFQRIEADLRDELLPSAQYFALAIREFAFKGEITSTGALSALSQRIAQEDLPPSVLDQIWEEIDTETRLLMLEQQLEECVAFIGSAGSAGRLNGDTKLASFVLDTLLIDESRWAEMACPTVTNAVCLRHIKAVINGINERKNSGDVFHDLPSMYREELSEAQLEALRKCAQSAGNLQMLVTALFDFIMMLKTASYNFDAYIFANLFDIGDGSLYDEQWYHDSFPRDIMNTQSYATYTALRGML